MTKRLRLAFRAGRVPLLIALVLTLAACETHGSVSGGGSDNGGAGRVRIGWPF